MRTCGHPTVPTESSHEKSLESANLSAESLHKSPLNDRASRDLTHDVNLPENVRCTFNQTFVKYEQPFRNA